MYTIDLHEQPAVLRTYVYGESALLTLVSLVSLEGSTPQYHTSADTTTTTTGVCAWAVCFIKGEQSMWAVTATCSPALTQFPSRALDIIYGAIPSSHCCRYPCPNGTLTSTSRVRAVTIYFPGQQLPTQTREFISCKSLPTHASGMPNRMALAQQYSLPKRCVCWGKQSLSAHYGNDSQSHPSSHSPLHAKDHEHCSLSFASLCSALPPTSSFPVEDGNPHAATCHQSSGTVPQMGWSNTIPPLWCCQQNSTRWA